MKRQLAFVFGGGGARGALQVGALRTLLEAGLYLDLLVGTSVGAVNAAFLALHGFTKHSLDELVRAWQEASRADLLPANYLWLTARALLGRPLIDPAQRMRDFFIVHGLAPGLCFEDIQNTRLILVAADMNTGQPILYGQDPKDSLLEGVLASTALPPWVTPIRKDGRLLVDGGTVSNLPIEPALVSGATKIIALDLTDSRDILLENHGFGPFLGKLIYTVEQRQQDLELALASAQGVPVTLLHLQ
jgi:NTE family protein